MTTFVPTIGLEVHCQLATRTKLFSACPLRPGAAPNTCVDGWTLGLPGSLPVVNALAVEYGLRLALAVGAEVQPRSRWARKHYFYPDLPKGYQITQAAEPYALGGSVEVPGPDGPRAIGLQRIHLEEDAGKLLHLPAEGLSLVDFNRAGAPLLEVVGRPEIRTPAEAAAFLRELRAIVRALGISAANMEEGTLRCDANVSLRRADADAPGTRCEIKNLNSFRHLELAIAAEIRRQSQILGRGEAVAPATLRYDVAADRTVVTRDKEAAADYRFLDEPDLPPLLVDAELLARVRAELPELPRARRARYAALGLAPADAALLTGEPALAAYFDAALALTGDAAARRLCNWLTVELLGKLHADGRAIETSPLTPAGLAGLIDLLATGALTGPQAKEVLRRSVDEGRGPREIVAAGGYGGPDADAVAAAVAAVLAAHPTQLGQLLAGKAALRGFFVGQVMRAAGGGADPRAVHEALDRALAARQNGGTT